MRQALIAVVVAVALISGLGSIRTISPTVPLLGGAPDIVVYGRNDCEPTRQALMILAESGADYRYLDITEEENAGKLVQRLTQAGVAAGRYYLPVMVVEGELSFGTPSNGGGEACLIQY